MSILSIPTMYATMHSQLVLYYSAVSFINGQSKGSQLHGPCCAQWMSGGSTMFPGIAERMQKEITALAPTHHEDQDHCSTRAQVQCLDRWFHPGFPLHLPADVDLQAGVR